MTLQPYLIRSATTADLSALLAMENACWAPALQASAAQLQRRIERFPAGQFLLEVDGRPAAVLYSQRIADRSLIAGSNSRDVEDLHISDGPIVQLLAVNVLPEMQHLGLGDQLLAHVLEVSAAARDVEHIFAVSLCRDYRRETGEALEGYIRRRDERGLLVDPILRFHEAHGAAISGLVPAYRPADHANDGHGVLVEYQVGALRSKPAHAGGAELADVVGCIRAVKPTLDPVPLARPLMECGFDSLDLMQLRLVLAQRFDVALNPAFFFSHGTAEAMARYFQELRAPVAAAPGAETRAAQRPLRDEADDAIAIVGMACRLPGGVASPDQFWTLLSQGRDAITAVPSSRWDAGAFDEKIATRVGGFVDDVDQFDAAFFNIGTKEANALDPQQRLLLEVSWEALERAGIDPASLETTRAGVFAGIFSHDYELLQVKRNAAGGTYDAYYATGSSASIAAGRIAYVLGCHGPVLTVDTACSSSLVAVHLACRSLLSGECDVALAGGVNLMLSPELSISFSTAGMLSPGGRCRTFDAAADGYVRSEGCGVVVLRPLSHALRDGDNVLAVIHGTASNHDGFSNGLTAPNGHAQERVMREALAAARVSPYEVSFVEAHGTGTPLGDPVEMRALASVYAQGRDAGAPLVVGAVKANIGHTEAAAGIAGLIKVVLAQQHRRLPGQLHFDTPNPDLDLESVPVVIPREGIEWRPPTPGSRLLAGVSSFGFSGTNAHIIIGEAPARAPERASPPPREWHAFTLSAATMPALQALAQRFETHLAGPSAESDDAIGDLCHTVNTGRAHLAFRLGAVARSTSELAATLRRFREGEPDDSLIIGRASRTARAAFAEGARAWPSTRDGVLELVRRHVEGEQVDWRALDRGQGLRTLPLPTYPFEHRRYWLEDATPIKEAARQRAPETAPAPIDDLLYQVEWHARSDGRGAPSCEGLLPELEALSTAYVAEAFRALGWTPADDAAAPDLAALGVVSDQRRFARWLLEMLRDAPASAAPGRSAEAMRAALASRYPDAEAEIAMLGRCASQLAGVLQGTVDPLGLLFPEADLTSAGRLYESSLTFAPMNRLLCDSVRDAVSALPPDAPLRVLEIGAGTGGTTASLVSQLEGRLSEYAFTDVSPLFLGKARDRFGALPFMRYGVLDVERDPAEQGYDEGRFDLVIASNVLHATRDLRSTLRHVRSLLAPGGMLVLVEGTRHSRWVDLIFGMLGGWWRFADHDLRPDRPLLPAAAWQQLLAESGFADTAALTPPDDAGLFEQSVLIARTRIATPAIAASRAKHWIVFCDRAGLGEEVCARLERRGDTCTRIPLPQDGQPPSREALVALLRDELKSHSRVHGCVHLWSLDAPERDALTLSVLEDTSRLNGASVLHLVQALIASELATPPRLWLVTRGAVAAGDGSLPGVAQSPLIGLAQVVSAEHPELRCTQVDLDPAAGTRNVDRLADEILADGGSARVAFRGGVRMEAQLARVAAADAGAPPVIRADRTYVIAGGLGALGLEVAQLLVARGARHLVLASRTGTASPDSPAAAVIRDLEQHGADVRVVSADISQAADVERLIGAIAGTGPALAGVVHAAGVFEDRLLADHDWALFERVLAAKVSGAWNLHLATRSLPLDFFVLFGSATNLICSSGLGNYVAANTFLDALAAHRRALGLVAVSIDWGPWAGVGMAEAVGGAREGQWANEGLAPIDRRQGLAAFGSLLGSPAPAVAVMSVDWQKYAARFPDAARSHFLAALAVVPAVEREPRADLPAELRRLSASDRQARLAAHISAAIGRVLGWPGSRMVDPELGLFRMGMDSLTSMELRNRLQRDLDCALPPTLTFKYPTVTALATYLAARLGGDAGQPAATGVPAAAAVRPVFDAAEPIAIIGMGCRFPGDVSSPDEFWELLRRGGDAIRELPAERWNLDEFYDPEPGTPGKTYVRDGGYLDGIDRFDAAFFGISPREATSMDPQHRLFLEVCWEALEHAGIAPSSLLGTRTGVFAGIGQDDYAQRRLRAGAVSAIDHYDGTGNLYCFAPGRLAYFLGLRGPNMAIDTACSSSLVAVQLAAQSLRNRECDVALAGAVHLSIAPDVTLFLSQARVLSRDGRCKTFDASADGFGRGEGSGAIVLKRLSDAIADGDRVLAVIRGAAVNHDGRTSGLTVPNEIAQAELIEQALRNGGIAAAEVSYVEAHGTGTSLGDPIEVNALVGALCADRSPRTPLLIGSVKTNVGHLEAAAGMAGLIKVVLALQHGEIPPHLHFTRPNPHIAWDRIPVEVTAEARPWRRAAAPRIAGVSSFGFSGTNAHVLVQEAPEPAALAPHARSLHVLALSARTAAALRQTADRYRRHLIAHPELDARDLCGTASIGRSHFKHRLAIVAADASGMRARLEAFLAGAPADGLRAGEPGPAVAAADLFASGADVDWARLYPKKSFRVAALPTYPFERERYWLDAPPSRQAHPVIDAAAPIVFETALGATSPAYLDHHRVFGAAVFPAAGFVDLALAAGQRVFRSSRFALEDVEILRALVLPETGATVVRTSLTREGDDRFAFTIQSVGHNGAAVTHVSGRMSAVAAPANVRTVDLATQLQACGEVLDVSASYRDFAAAGIAFGADFMAVRELRRGANGSLGHVRLADRLVDDSRAHGLHPVLLDACFQSSMSSWAGEGSAAFLPVSIERVEASLSPARELWSLATPRPAHGIGDSRVLDLDVFDASGATIATVTGLALRASDGAALRRAASPAALRAPGPEAALDSRAWLHALEWHESPRRPAPRASRRWVVLADGHGVGRRLAHRLRERGDDVVQIARGDREPLARLVSTSADAALHVIHLWSLDDAEAVTSGAPIPEVARDGCESVFSLLSEAGPSLAALWIVTRGAQAVGAPADIAIEQSPLWGLDKVIAIERPDLRGACIDLDPRGNEDDADALIEELSSVAGRPGVAFRGAKRYELRLAPRGADSSEGQAVIVRPEAAYLITGGFGALGSRVAGWLAGQGATHLVLCGRHASSAVAREIVSGLEQRGVQVMAAEADVAEAGALQAVLEEAAASMPPLRGIVHAAGVVDDAPLDRFDREALGRVFAPKVSGAWNLHALTRDAALDFFVCFSSAASMIGSAGQGYYAAANAFMDALVWRRRSMGLSGVSINWGAWSGAGMAAGVSDRVQARWDARGFASISPEAGLDILGRVAGGPLANIGVLPIEWDSYLTATFGDQAPPLFALVAPRPATASEAPSASALTNLESASAEEARKALADLVRAEMMLTLGLRSADAIDARTSFFELGLDSLTAAELRHRLRAKLGREIGATTIFDYPSLVRLVDRLLETVGGHIAPAPRQQDAQPAAALDIAEHEFSTELDEPVEAAIADELERLEALLASPSHE